MLNKVANRNCRRELIITLFYAVLAALFFIPLFLFRGFGPIDFWWWMSAALVILIVSGIIADRNYFRALKADIATKAAWKIAAGLGAACVLFALFFFGNIISRYLIELAGRDINAIYGFKENADPLRIVMLMALIIGPGEELFWRGFLQRRFSDNLGDRYGFVISTALYALVHTASGNFMLVAAALVCGVFWGFLYYKYKSLTINIISHTVWDIAVFFIFPFAQKGKKSR
jgi:uncharacterized protein